MFTTLVSAEELARHLDDPDWIVCDCRHDLADYEAGRRAYAEGHIPGARFLHLDEDLSGPKTGVNGRHPLPHPATFALRLGALGIDNAKQIVAYDASGGPYAARLWWMLRWVGHANVAVLDGGWQAWTGAAIRWLRHSRARLNRPRSRRGCTRISPWTRRTSRHTSVTATSASSMRAAPTAFAAKTKRSIPSAATSPARPIVSSD